MENIPPSEDISSLPERTHTKKYFLYTIVVSIILVLGYFFFFSSPKNFPTGIIINIEAGINLRKLSLKLKKENIIRSRMAFEAFIILYEGERRIKPGDYLFDKVIPVHKVAKRINEGKHNLVPIKVTIPEGFNIIQIGETLSKKMTNFNLGNFLLKAKNKEGYLFPDTYFFLTTDNEEHALKSMSNNYEKKIAPLRPAIIASGKTEKEIITMASIIEEEAKGDDDRSVISGILWKRISIGMPLQADAAPITYKEKGLPDNPISNPGLKSINAAINPTESAYLFYLHDKDGNIHYAKNFEEHKLNKTKYLSR